MCRPPDLAPTGTGLDDALEGYPVDGVDDWNEGNLEAGDFEGSDIAYATLLGKRDVTNNEGRISDAASRAAKFPRAAAPVSSAFDSAAASFMAKMEQSMLEDLRRQQNQRRMAVAAAAAAAAPEQESLLVQRALLEQRNQLQQLQQLQLLQQLQRSKAQAAALQAQQQQVLPEQQQLLLAQKQLLQQSQSKLLGALAPAAVAPVAQLNQAAAWAALTNKAQAPAASLLAPAASAEAKIQAWMQAGVLNPAVATVTSGLAPRNLPTLHPRPAAPVAAAVLAAAGAGAELNSAAAAAMFGLGHLAQSGLHCGGMVVGEEKKAKRMQSNRASAKRSRQRRQARLEELDKSTVQLHAENNTVVVKLEEAQKEIVTLEQKNRSLQEEVSLMRKMLGMEALPLSAGKVKVQGSPAASGAQQQSCVESEGGTLEAFCNTSAMCVKGEAESEVALGVGDHEEDDGEEEEAEGNECSLDWLGNMPLSPVGDMKPESPLRALMDSDVGSPALDQFLVQGDVFSELLACLDG